MSSISPTVFADKVHLTSAGVSCLGGDRDETIVETILLTLEKASLKAHSVRGGSPDKYDEEVACGGETDAAQRLRTKPLWRG